MVNKYVLLFSVDHSWVLFEHYDIQSGQSEITMSVCSQATLVSHIFYHLQMKTATSYRFVTESQQFGVKILV